MATPAEVRKALKPHGYSVQKFNSCWFVVDGDSSEWFSSSLNCYRLDHKTAEQWTADILAMRDEHRRSKE